MGQQTLDVIRRNGSAFSVAALAANSNVEILEQQALEFNPKIISMASPAHAAELRRRLGSRFSVLDGPDAVIEAARMEECDTVVQALVGFEGLRTVLASIEAGKQIALANKESLVAGGELVGAALRKSKAALIPVDSEHSALFQCLLVNRHLGPVKQLMLTASGGPFWKYTAAELENVRAEDAVKHPRWSMGKKISVDSATLMNKGLEVIEAHYLFGIPAERIEVLVHPQSIIHGIVEYQSGASIASMYNPDMRVPIGFALMYAANANRECALNINCGTSSLALTETGRLEFAPPDHQRFRALNLCYEALKRGSSYPCVLNAANEVAVHHFLENKIRFVDLSGIVEEVINRHTPIEPKSYDELVWCDSWARAEASRISARL